METDRSYIETLSKLRAMARVEEQHKKSQLIEVKRRLSQELHKKRQELTQVRQSMLARFDGKQHIEKQRFEQHWEQETGALMRAVEEARAIPISQLNVVSGALPSHPSCAQRNRR